MAAKSLALACNLIGALLSFVAAYYWLRSTKSNLPAIDPQKRTPAGSISMSELNATIVQSAEANKTAAICTGIATLFLAVGSLIGSLDC